MSFKVIETQEQFDAMIGERLERERNSVKKEYEEYIAPDKFKEAQSSWESKESELQNALTEANNKISEKDTKIREHETSATKYKVAHEMGLSYDAVEFISGTDEESIKSSAELLKGLIGSSRGGDPYGGSEPRGNAPDDKEAAFKEMIKSMKKGE